MRKSLRMAGVAGAAALATLCGTIGADLLAVAHADCIVRLCQPTGARGVGGVFCSDRVVPGPCGAQQQTAPQAPPADPIRPPMP
jgi:hypothetical protein